MKNIKETKKFCFFFKWKDNCFSSIVLISTKHQHESAMGKSCFLKCQLK